MNKTHDCNWCAMSSCGTTVTPKPSPLEPTTTDSTTTLTGSVTMSVETATTLTEPTTTLTEPATTLTESTTTSVEPVTTSTSSSQSPSGECLNTIKVQLNPTVVPAKFTRYRHPSHHHRLFMIISLGHNYCNNKNCNININSNKTMFRCFRCDYDLCDRCFQLSTSTAPVPLAEDDNDVNETTLESLVSSMYVVAC